MAEKKTHTPPTPHTLTDILREKITPKKTIWGCITERSVTLLYGTTGVGKSNFTLGLSIAVAARENFCGFYVQSQPKIILLDGEMDRETWANRIRWIRPEDQLNVLCDSISFLTRDDFGTGLVPNISLPESQSFYDKIFLPYGMVIIDNLNTTSYPRNDRDGEIQQFLRVMPWLLKMRDSGKAVILIHHTNKSGQQMGSVLKEQIADNVIRLDKISSNSDNLDFKIVYEKHRHLSNKDCKSVDISAIPDKEMGMTWFVSDPMDNIEDKIREMLDKKEQPLAIAKTLNISTQLVFSYMNESRREM